MARLGAGTRKCADGTLEKRFTIDGKRYSVYGKNAKEISQKEQEIGKKIEAGIYMDNRNVKLQKMERRQVLSFQKDLSEGELSIRTCNNIMKILKIVMNDAVTDEIIIKNPAEEKAKLHTHEPKKASIKPSNIYTVDRSPKIKGSKIAITENKKFRRSTIHLVDNAKKEMFRQFLKESKQSINVDAHFF